jgi:hypothetical protein
MSVSASQKLQAQQNSSQAANNLNTKITVFAIVYTSNDEWLVDISFVRYATGWREARLIKGYRPIHISVMQ